jgi:predicted glycosyltransferase
MSRPALLFYCQHSVGLGHLMRSYALCAALSERFRVVLVSGGPRPDGIAPPAGVEIVALPALGVGPDGRFASHDRRFTIERAWSARRERILATLGALGPAVVLVELFPFGRKRFAGELLPVLEAARAARTVVACSLRDILVGRDDQEEHDERACILAGRYFDAVLVHADPRLARLEETFKPRTPLAVPVHYTGFVTRGPARPARPATGTRPATGARPVVVSAGGGRVGEPLLRTAVAAHRLLEPGTPMTVVTGPMLPPAAWRALRAAARGQDRLTLHRSLPDLAAELAGAAASVSQCGYNTAIELLRARIPALVVPFTDAGEDEQTRRAWRLAGHGAVRVLEPARLDPAILAAEIRALRSFRPRPVEVSLDGVRTTERLLLELCGLEPTLEAAAL